MRRNDGFILRKAADLTVIVPVGREAVRFPGMLSVNETGRFLWELLQEEQTRQTLARALTDTFQVEGRQAEQDVHDFLEKLRAAGAVLEGAP